MQIENQAPAFKARRLKLLRASTAYAATYLAADLVTGQQTATHLSIDQSVALVGATTRGAVQRELRRRRKAAREEAIRQEALRRGVSIATVVAEAKAAAVTAKGNVGNVGNAGNGATTGNGVNGNGAYNGDGVGGNGGDAAVAAWQQLHDIGAAYADMYDRLMSGALSPAEAAEANKRLNSTLRAVKATLRSQDHHTE
jgi:hypothetical protein